MKTVFFFASAPVDFTGVAGIHEYHGEMFDGEWLYKVVCDPHTVDELKARGCSLLPSRSSSSSRMAQAHKDKLAASAQSAQRAKRSAKTIQTDVGTVHDALTDFYTSHGKSEDWVEKHLS